MLSLVSLNSEFERNENIANARAIYHSQTATALTVKPYPPRASLFSAPSASALCCGCRECRTHGRTKANTAAKPRAVGRRQMTKKTENTNTWTDETRQMIKLARWVSDRGATTGQQERCAKGHQCGQAPFPSQVPLGRSEYLRT
eukprot:scaffold128848_cov57-Phaeocystis_antarctica.AAC.1